MVNIHNSPRFDSKKRKNNFINVNSLLPAFFGILALIVFSSVPVYAETITVDVNGESYDVEYSATGVTLTGIEADLDFFALILDVSVSGADSTLDITFDRSFFDSQFEDSDDAFFVLTDGDESNFTETNTTEQSRTLSIEVPSGTEEIEIIGSVFASPTQVVVVEAPEPVVEAPEPVVEAPEPVVEAPEPVVEAPEPVVEAPEPVVEAPEPVVEVPKTQCGPGTVLHEGVCVLESAINQKTQCGPGTTLQDGVCVLDERCGPGTTFQDGVCVLEPTSSPKITDTSVKGLGKELGVGLIVAFVAAGVIGLILALMSKASKSKD